MGAVLLDFVANFDRGVGRLQLVELDVNAEPEVEGDSPAATWGCITFDDKSHVKLVKSLSLSSSIFDCCSRRFVNDTLKTL